MAKILENIFGKRTMAMLLAVVMVLGMLPTNVLAVATAATIELDEVTDTTAEFSVTDTSGKDTPMPMYVVTEKGDTAPTVTDFATTGDYMEDTFDICGGIFDLLYNPGGTATLSIDGLTAATDYVLYISVTTFGSTDVSDIVSYEFSTIESSASGDSDNSPNDNQGAVMSISYQVDAASEKEVLYFEDYKEAETALNELDSTYLDVELTLLSNVEMEMPTVYMDYAFIVRRSCTIDLAGYTWSVAGSDYGDYGGILIGDNSEEMTVKIKDTSAACTGKISGTLGSADVLSIGSSWGGAGYAYNPINFEMEDVTIESSLYETTQNADALHVSGNATTTFTNCKINGYVYCINTMTEFINCTITSGSASRALGISMHNVDETVTLNNTNVYSTYDGSNLICAVGIYSGISTTDNDLSTDDFSNQVSFHMIDSDIYATSGVAIYISTLYNEVLNIVIEGDSNITAEKNLAFWAELTSVSSVESTRFGLDVREGASIYGETGTIEVTGYSTNLSIVDVAISNDTFWGYGENARAFLPHSGFVAYPDGFVMDVSKSTEPGYENYYGIVSKDGLDYIVNDYSYGYQYFEDLNAEYEVSEAIYLIGNVDGLYSSELWAVFEVAYEAASEFLSANTENANQNEIDYFQSAMSQARAAMVEDVENVIDLSQLANGEYTVEIEMWNASKNDGTLSMANGAVDSQAVLSMKDGVGTVVIDFGTLVYGVLQIKVKP